MRLQSTRELENVNESKFHPASLRAALTQQPNKQYRLIVLAKRGRHAEVIGLARSMVDRNIGPPGTETLDLIEGVAVSATMKQVEALSDAEAVGAIWGIAAAIHEVYVRIIRSLGNAVQNKIRVVNISLAPPRGLLDPHFDPEEPMNLATRAAADKRLIVVFAAANYGPVENTLNPWSVAPWVLSVGAASEDGKRLADFSSRGVPSDPLYRPTVVAPGIDQIVAHPSKIPKTEEQLSAEMRIGFKQRVPWLKHSQYTVVSGTSFACPVVVSVAGQIIYFMDHLRLLLGKPEIPPDATWAQIYTHGRTATLDDRLTTNRLAGKLTHAGGASTGSYPFHSTPAVVKQIVMDMALGMPPHKPHEIGAGFVSQPLALHYFGRFGRVAPEITSYKVL
jgi:subtilisin family serine protease